MFVCLFVYDDRKEKQLTITNFTFNSVLSYLIWESNIFKNFSLNSFGEIKIVQMNGWNSARQYNYKTNMNSSSWRIWWKMFVFTFFLPLGTNTFMLHVLCFIWNQIWYPNVNIKVFKKYQTHSSTSLQMSMSLKHYCSLYYYIEWIRQS